MAKTPDWLSRAVKEGRVQGKNRGVCRRPGVPQVPEDLWLELGFRIKQTLEKSERMLGKSEEVQSSWYSQVLPIPLLKQGAGSYRPR